VPTCKREKEERERRERDKQKEIDEKWKISSFEGEYDGKEKKIEERKTLVYLKKCD
jgi:hypothetical protein